jgi:hypothetical protein
MLGCRFEDKKLELEIIKLTLIILVFSGDFGIFT